MAVLAANGLLMANGVPAVTWDPAAKNSLVNLSNGSRTATRASASSAWVCARATAARSVGKRYFEVMPVAVLTNGVEGGLCTAAFPFGSGFIDSSTQAWALFSLTGQPYHNGATVGAALGAIGNGQRMGFAVDFDAGKIWVSRLGSFSGDPAAGTGERFTFTPNTPLYPVCALYVEFQQLTGAFRSADFAHAPPTGFSAWEG